MTISEASGVEQTHMPRLKRIDGLDGVHVLAVMLVWISRIFIAAPKLLGQNWCRVFTRGGYLGVKGFLCKGGS